MTSILIERLTPFLECNSPDPWAVGFKLSLLKRAREPILEMYSTSSSAFQWTALDHARRIRAIMSNPVWYNDPIHLDNHCDGSYIYAIPVVLDGWHRYFAHLAKKDTLINVSYGGRIDLLRYLQGKRKTCPSD